MDKLTKTDITQIDQQVERFMTSLPAAKSAGRHRGGRQKRHKETKHVEVSINSLLDVLSVILVFLMKSYSTTTVQVKPSKDLQVPFTQSTVPVEESTALTLTRKHVMINDEPVLSIENGKVDSNHLAEQGMLIEPLFAKLTEEMAYQKRIAEKKGVPFKGVVSLICDRHVPFPLVTQALYTAGQAQYSQFKVVLIKGERS